MKKAVQAQDPVLAAIRAAPVVDESPEEEAAVREGRRLGQIVDTDTVLALLAKRREQCGPGK